MKINLNNVTKIQSALDTCQNGCSARLATLESLSLAIVDLDNNLDKILFKKDQKGAKFSIVTGWGKVASSYRGHPDVTMVELERGASNWFLIKVARVPQSGGGECKFLNVANYKDQLVDFISKQDFI